MATAPSGPAHRDPDSLQVDLVERERDLYLRLLNLGTQNDLPSLLKEALGLLTEVAGAHQGYLEFGRSGTEGVARWWTAHGFSAEDLELIRAATSRGIIAEALETGRTIVTQSALLDPRFQSRESVRSGRIEAVLCAPIGADPAAGVLYLQRRFEPGAFLLADRAKVETVARYLAPFADRLLVLHERREENDPTRRARDRLRAIGVIGRSAALAALLDEVAAAAPLDVTVLLTGESGTGKSQIARVIHDNSPRASQPFVELNCAAIPESLIESELFGAMPGAHSTATRRIEGRVASAEGGTLFLDEVGELAFGAQAKLLQLLQSGVYYPLGSARPVQANARIIAASNTDLENAVKERRFREDLFYRLQVLPIRMPSLAERREDIAELAAHFCSAACKRHHLPHVSPSPLALRALEAAEWPGNIRQLGNAVAAAAIRAAGLGALQLEREHLFPHGAPSPCEAGAERLTFQEATRRFQARLLRETLTETGWNVVEATRRLDLTRSHIYNLIRAFGLERERK